MPKIQVTEKRQFIDQIFMPKSSILTESKDSVKHSVEYNTKWFKPFDKDQSRIKYLVVGKSCLQFMFLIQLTWLKRMSDPFQDTGSMHQTRNRHFTTR